MEQGGQNLPIPVLLCPFASRLQPVGLPDTEVQVYMCRVSCYLMTYDVIEWKGFPNSPEVVMLFFQPEYKFKFSCFQNFLLSIGGCSIATIAFFISAPASRPLTPPVLPCSRPSVSLHCVVHDSSHSEHKIRFILSLFEAIFLHVRFYFFVKSKS